MITVPAGGPHATPSVTLDGQLDDPGPWLWLIKWVLATPHYLLLLLILWPAMICSAALAGLVMFVGGRYPRPLFVFNLGVLRWTWRVAFYSYAANGTDRYPPFTLRQDANYPARLTVTYPTTQRHGLPLLGRWLTGLPQYLVCAVLVGGLYSWPLLDGVGVIGLLVLFACVVLLADERYPEPLFGVIVGLNRWVARTLAYATLMTSEYPPFRLDPGQTEVEADTRPPARSAPRQDTTPGA